MKPQHFAILAGSMLLLAAVLALAGRPAPAEKAQAVPPERLVTVTGEAEVRVKPDLAIVIMGVWTHGASAMEAEALHVASLKKVQVAMEDAGAEETGFETISTSLQPTTYQDYAGVARISGYQARTTFRALVRNTARVQSILEAGMATGATSLESVTYTLENPEAARQGAMKQAVDNARIRAVAMAKTQGESLGAMRSMEVLAEEAPPVTGSASPSGLVFRAKVRASFSF